MKVLHIIDSGGLYGAEVVLLNLVTEQVKQGLEPIIASIGEKGIAEKPLETEATMRGFRIEKFRMTPGPNYMGALKMLKFARKEGVDILHSHGYKGNILFGLMPKRIRRIPMVTTIHGWTSTGNGFGRMRLYEWLDSKSLRLMDTVVLVSEAMKSHSRLRCLNQSRVHVIHNGIPIQDHAHPHLPTFPPSDAADLDPHILSFCRGGYTIGAIGRLSTEKGYRYLIEALVLLIDEGIDAQLVIMGEGYERDYLKGLVAQFELTNRVMLSGYREDAKQYLPYFNVFVISSLTEGLPITLLEAMHARTPVVATEVGGIPEVLEQDRAGLLIEPCKPDAIAIAIRRLHCDKELANELKSGAYHRVTIRYASNTMALGYIDIYNALIDDARARQEIGLRSDLG
ncbi:MAG: hypothetical protein BA862_14315 [Desulfobulbaceae bacterium S3730MH12]|nr:MAG: hypothetical protein BA862_14315 [Desulfobulbaceae bacterium S3730MH12]